VTAVRFHHATAERSKEIAAYVDHVISRHSVKSTQQRIVALT
jgi:hypothetical protein